MTGDLSQKEKKHNQERKRCAQRDPCPPEPPSRQIWEQQAKEKPRRSPASQQNRDKAYYVLHKLALKRCFHPQSLLRLPRGRRWMLRWVVNGAIPEPPLFIPESWGYRPLQCGLGGGCSPGKRPLQQGGAPHSPTALGRRILLPTQRQKASGIRDQAAMLGTRGCFRAGGKCCKRTRVRNAQRKQSCSALLSGRGALPGQESTAERAARILLRDSGSAPDASRPAACLLSSFFLSQETDNDHFP